MKHHTEAVQHSSREPSQKEQAKARYQAFAAVHDPVTREKHWQHKKDPACVGCRQFMQEVQRAGFTR